VAADELVATGAAAATATVPKQAAAMTAAMADLTALAGM
jgi:hypothetical protein